MEDTQDFAISLLKNKPEKFDFNTINFTQVIKFLKKNKVSLIELLNNKHHKFFSNFFDSKEFKKAYQIESQHYNDWRNDFIKVKNEWKKEEIDYIFHKSTGQFPYLSGNLDIIVKSRYFQRAGDILKEMGFINLRNIQEPHKEYYRKFHGDIGLVPIHLHERVCWCVPFEDNEHLWYNYQVSENDELAHYPSYEDIILITLAHHFLEDHVIFLSDLLKIKKCLRSKRLDWDYIVSTAKRLKWEHSLYTAIIMFEHFYNVLFDKKLFFKGIVEESNKYIKDKKWISNYVSKEVLIDNIKMPFHISHYWTRKHTSLREFKDPIFGTKFDRFAQVFGGLFDRFIHLKLGMKTHPSMFITFSGLDGSGKTKHIKTLCNTFQLCDIPTRHLWSRSGSFPIITLVLKIFRLFKSGASAKTRNTPLTKKGKWPMTSFTKMAWRIINTIDMIIYYFLKIKIPLLFGKVVIADRYVYDSIVDLENIENPKNFDRQLYKILKFIIPTPDLAFFLELDPKTIIKREVKEDIDELSKKYSFYKKILSKTNLVTIDNSKTFDKVSDQIYFIALNKFYEKYPEKYKCYKTASIRYK